MNQADSVHSTPPTNTSAIPSRRSFLTQSALAATAIATAGPAVAAMPSSNDSDLIALGAQFEPLLDRYYPAHKAWSRLLSQARREHDQQFGEPAERGYEDTPEIRAAWSETCQRLGVDGASDRQSSIWEEMEPIANAIAALPCTSIEGLRVKALVAFWEVQPLYAGASQFFFEDADPFQRIFTAVAELCGLNDKIAATGYSFPELWTADNNPEDDENGEDCDGEDV